MSSVSLSTPRYLNVLPVMRRVVALLWALAAGTGCDNSAAALDRGGIVSAQQAQGRDAIVGGSPVGSEHGATAFLLSFDPTKDLSRPQKAAICSAVRIAPDVLLTAAHCVTGAAMQGLTSTVVSSEPTPMAPLTDSRAFGRVRYTVAHDNYSFKKVLGKYAVKGATADIALVFLAKPDFDAALAMFPSYDGLDVSGDAADLFTVAYGTGYQGYFANQGYGVKRTANLNLKSLTDTDIVVTAHKATMCVGDSGAPMFSRKAPNVVLGLVSTSHSTLFGYCRGPSRWTRVQHYQSWIEDVLDYMCAQGLRDAACCQARPEK